MITALAGQGKAFVKQRLGPFVAGRQPSRVDLPPAWWGLAVGSNGTLHSDGVDLAELARREGTPLHVVRGDRLDQAARAAVEVADDADVFASYKTNPVPGVLARLHQHGIGAEVVSPYELWLAQRLGVPGFRLIYNGPSKSSASISEAIRSDAYLVNANSASDAARIAALAAEQQRVVHLGVRVSLPVTWGGQFGIGDIDTAAAVVRGAQDDPWVDMRGLHVHRGITIRDAATMTMYVEAVLAFAAELRARTGWSPAVLDLGGSLACPTSAGVPHRQMRLNRAFGADLLPPDPDDCLRIADAARLAADLVRSDAAAAGVAVPRVVLEPGRALTGDTQFMLACVLDVKDDSELAHAVLDVGMNTAEPVTSEYHQLFPVTSAGERATTPYRLTGPTCTPADVLYQHWRLPQLAPGDVVAIMDTGAYFVPYSNSFSFPRPGIVMQDGATYSVIRRRETFDDIVALDDF